MMYNVKWMIELDAKDPMEAAQQALDSIINGTAKVFEVVPINESMPKHFLIDLDKKPVKNHCSIWNCDASTRVINVLKQRGIKDLVQLYDMTEFELLRERNFGRKSLNELKEIMQKLSIQFKK